MNLYCSVMLSCCHLSRHSISLEIFKKKSYIIMIIQILVFCILSDIFACFQSFVIFLAQTLTLNRNHLDYLIYM